MGISALIEAAKKEDWKFVDSHIPQVTKDLDVARWAINNGLEDRDGNVRDLAASILVKSQVVKLQEIEERLHKVLLVDENPYARYRAAFALAKHQSQRFKSDILNTLQEASKDPEVSVIAKRYTQKYL